MMSFCSGVIWYFSARIKSLASRPGALERELVMSTWSFTKEEGKKRMRRYIPKKRTERLVKRLEKMLETRMAYFSEKIKDIFLGLLTIHQNFDKFVVILRQLNLWIILPHPFRLAG